MKTPQSLHHRRPARSAGGYTLVEMLFVIVIIVVLATLAFVGFNKAIDAAHRAKSVSNVTALCTTCHTWATDHAGKLPSPEYPGDYKSTSYPTKGASPRESNPKYWDLDDSGLWLNGVVFARLYIEGEDSGEINPDEKGLEDFHTAGRATDGRHLVGTAFESPASVDKNRSETDWYRHSFAMNANLQFDGMFAEVGGANDAWLTEKTLGNLEFQSNACLFVDCIEQNVVMAEDIELIRDASSRYNGRSVVVGYVDGHVDVLKINDIPEGDIYSDMEASRFWRGVREDSR